MQTNIELENPLLFVHAFDYAAIGMAVIATDGTLLKVNESLCKIFGYKEEELLSLTCQEIIHPDDLESIKALAHEILEGKRKTCHIEKRYIHKKGNEIWTILSVSLVKDNKYQPLYFVSQIQDITDRKLAEERANEGEKRYKRLVENSPDAVIISRNGKCVYINESGAKLFGGKSKYEIIGRSCYDFVPLSDKEKLKARFHRTMEGETIVATDEKLVRLDGKLIDVQVRVLPTYFENKPAIHIILRDITESKRTQELLLNSEKLTVAGQLAAGIAHEIRNPLTAIKGFIHIMKEHATNDNRMYIDVISSEIERIETILSELLVLAKPQETKIGSTNIKVLLSHVTTLIETQTIMNNIEIIKHIDPDIPLINCDENQIKQVLINLLKNAIEAMSKGGEIYIEVKKYNLQSIIFRVVDQGSGIPEKIVKTIGEPFFTTKEEGTGLGLMICNQIIENHKGKIHIDSSPNGTKVEVVLPLS